MRITYPFLQKPMQQPDQLVQRRVEVRSLTTQQAMDLYLMRSTYLFLRKPMHQPDQLVQREGRNEILADPYSYNLVTKLEYDQMAESLRMPDTNATPYTDGWFFIPDHGWLWTIKQAYPWFYDANSSDWLYFKQGGSQPRFYEYASKKWVEWPDFVKKPWDSHYEEWLKNPEPYGGANVLGLIKRAKNEQKTKLDLGDYYVKDLAPLSGLKHLTALNIGDNDITDISVLSQLDGLTRLVLKDNKNLVDLASTC